MQPITESKTTDTEQEPLRPFGQEALIWLNLKGNLRALLVRVLTSNLPGSVLDHVET